MLSAIYPYLPKGTIVLAIVDPGVGSQRQALCIKTSRGFLIGPNNGIFTSVLEEEEPVEARGIVNDRYWIKPVSATFHGRDIFAPAAAWLSKRDVFRSFGPAVRHIEKLRIPKAVQRGNSVTGEIIYVDRFGNAITNISKRNFPKRAQEDVRVLCRGRRNASLKPFFSAGSRGSLIAVWNSGNLLELAVRNDSAERLFGLKPGDPVTASVGVR